MMRFASLGSGSQGNALIVDAGDTKLLLDCGFSARATVERLGRLSVAAENIDGVLVTQIRAPRTLVMAVLHDAGVSSAGYRRNSS